MLKSAWIDVSVILALCVPCNPIMLIQALGRHLYIVDCCALTNAAALRRLLFGALHTGSLLQLDNLHHLPQLLMIHLATWLGVLAKALANTSCMSKPIKGNTIAKGSSSTLHKEVSPSFQASSSIGEHETALLRSSTLSCSPNAKPLGTPTNSVVSSRVLPSHLTDRTRTKGSSRATTRLDWYQFVQEGKPAEMGLSGWFGYGGEARKVVEMADSTVLHVSPAFGCILVGNVTADDIPEQLKVRHCSIEYTVYCRDPVIISCNSSFYSCQCKQLFSLSPGQSKTDCLDCYSLFAIAV